MPHQPAVAVMGIEGGHADSGMGEPILDEAIVGQLQEGENPVFFDVVAGYSQRAVGDQSG